MSALRYLFPLVLVGGGIALAVSSAKADAKKKKVNQALDLGLDNCSVSESQIEGFAQSKGYQIYYFTTPANNQKPKPAFANNPNARAFDVSDCRFERYDGSAWVPDTVTQAEFDAWLNSGEGSLPIPPASEKAYSTHTINQSLFAEWWYQTGYPETGVMGFWLDVSDPIPIDELLPNSNYTDAVVVTNDGAFWVYENGWHPSARLANEYDAWAASVA